VISVARQPLRVFEPESDVEVFAPPAERQSSPSVSSAATWKSIRSIPTTNFSLAQLRLEANEPLVEPEGNLERGYRIAKRLLDILGAAVFLVLFSPILIGVFIVLWFATKGKPIIRQERVGHLGRRFPMYKFRTMRLDADKLQHLVRNEQNGPIFKNRHDPRITRIGRILRRTSIDEMPQLFNVLVGHMSLVGPRPPLAKEVAQYKAWHRRRLAIKPGLTCLWQISGRSEIGFDQWVRMDIWYARNQDLLTDIKLLVRTPLSVLSCRGAY
jgi:lipopolysaccharide/colanic/teichoic acid biosynthesis glycosyltransferase